ncbi:hypothetical protein Tco_1021554, partial [Tanacetum coccineum]
VMHANDDNLDYAKMERSYIDEYSRCLKLEAELSRKKDMDAPEFPEFFEINDLKAQLKKKNSTISNLKDHIETLKGKSVSDCSLPVNNYNVTALRMYKLDLQPLSPKLRKNREVHVDYLKQTKEHANTLRDIVEQVRALQPLDSALDYACKFTTRIQELLVYVTATCPSSLNKSEKLVAVTPMNKSRKVKFAEPRVNNSTHVSRSKPKGNTRNNRIS